MTPFVKASEVKAGDTLITDAGFTCLKAGTRCVVQQDQQYLGTDDEFAGLFVTCSEGKHYLGGQLGGQFGGFDSDEYLVGFWKEEEPPQ